MSFTFYPDFSLITTYDVSGGDSNFLNDPTNQEQDISGSSIISVGLVWAGLTGTLDAVVSLEQSNDGVNWEDMGISHVLNTAGGSKILSDTTFSGKQIRAVLTVNGCTGGNLDGQLIGKR